MLCEQIPELEVVKSFDNPNVFISEFSSLEFDLCILDIEMPEINGLQLANLLNGKPVVFTSAYKEYAAEAFDINAIDFVSKPIKKERLQQAVLKVINYLSGNTKIKKHIQLNTNKGKALIYFNRLCYVKTSETDSRDKIAYLDDGSEFILKNISFEKLLSYLPSNDFCRVNKRELIALKIAQVISFDEISTSIKDSLGKPIKITLSESYKNDFLKKVTV